MKFVSLKFGQGNSESTVADQIAQDESPEPPVLAAAKPRFRSRFSNVIPSSESAQRTRTNKLD
jgi:hypothetical protein